MAARAMWKARICLGDLRIGVKLYSAVEDIKVHFRLLHAADLAPVSQKMTDPLSSEIVPKEDIQRGVEVDEGVFVIITPEEREALQPPPSRDIHVTQVVSPARVDLRWFDRPYYLGPDDDATSYFALAQALERQDDLAIAHWVMRKKHYHGALHAKEGYLRLETLRNAEELVELGDIVPAPQNKPDPKERKLAEQLIGALAGDFDPAAYSNQYQERVRELIEAKAEGREITYPTAPRASAAGSLREALEASLTDGREASRGH